MLLRADLGSDGYSTLVNGVSLRLGLPFWIVNLVTGGSFVALAATRGVIPGLGTVVQVVLVGITVSVLLDIVAAPEGLVPRLLLLAAAFPVLAVGIAVYLGSNTGAGPAEALALAFDPPVAFKWTFNAVQGLGALAGWLLGATIGVGTIAVILLLGPAVDFVSRLLGLEVHQGSAVPQETSP